MKSKWLYLSFVLALLAACGDETTDNTDDTDGTSAVTFVDVDGDKFPLDVDCDDNDKAVNPGAAETYYDGKDNDCDAATIDDDQDGDGVAEADDCDDTDASINPDAAEVADGIDNNCDGETMIASEEDNDGDGFSAAAGDCNDLDADVNPDAAEVYYDGVNNDCDASTKDKDQDGDGSKVNADCDDLNADRSPDNNEMYYNELDDDCDLATIDGDKDGDGFTATSVGGSDCADGNADRNPGMGEVPGDGVDNDCSGADLAVNATSGIFVDATVGDDLNAGTKALPKKTIQAAADAIYRSGKTVFVAEGVYVESVTTTVSIVGGFSNVAGVWSYAPGSNPVQITSDTAGSAAIDILADADVSLVSLDIAGYSAADYLSSGRTSYGVLLDASANALRLYSSTVTSGRDYNGRPVAAWNADLVSVVDSSLTSVASDTAVAFYMASVGQAVVRGSSLVGSTNNYCGGVEIYGTTMELHDSSVVCTDSDRVRSGNDTYLVYGQYGRLRMTGNTLGSADVTEAYNYYGIYSDDGLYTEAANNTLNLGENNSHYSMLYMTYTGVRIEDNTFAIGDRTYNSDSAYLVYAYEGDYVVRNNTFTLGANDFDGDGDLYLVEAQYGKLNFSGNSISMDDNGNRWNYLDGFSCEYGSVCDYSGTTVSLAPFRYGYLFMNYSGASSIMHDMDVQVAAFDSDRNENAYVFDGPDDGEFDMRDSVVEIGYVEADSFYPFNLYDGVTYIENVDFSYGAVTAYVEGYGEGVWTMRNVDMTFERVEDTWCSDFYLLYVEYARAQFDQLSLYAGDLESDECDGHLIYTYDTQLTLTNSRLEFENAELVNNIYGIYADDGGTYVYDNNDIVLGFNDERDNYGIYQRYGSAEITNNYVYAGETWSDVIEGDDIWGIYVEYGLARLANNVVEMGASGDEAFGLYLYGDGLVAYASNNYFAATTLSVADDVYGVYIETEGYYVLQNNIINAGAADEFYTNYGVYIDSPNARTVLQGNIFTSEANEIDVLVYDSSAGDLTTMTEVNDCSAWAACVASRGNKKVTDPDNIFVNRANGNFKQKASSPAINAGVDVNQYGPYGLAAVDMNGTARPSAGGWDIGPDELP